MEHRKYTDKELLDIINSASDNINVCDEDLEIAKFKEFFNILEGSHAIKVGEMYALYCQYTSNPLPYKMFRNHINLKRKGHYYFVNFGQLNIDTDIWSKVKDHVKKFRETRKKI